MKIREQRPEHAPSPQRSTHSDRAVTPGKRTLTMGLPARSAGGAAAVQRRAAAPMPAGPSRSERAGGPAEDWMAVALRPDLYQAPIMRKSVSDIGYAGPEALPAPAHGGGSAMPAPVQAKMEQSFGTDFSAVRVHEGPQAPAIGALAYTQGTDIHFAPGQYDPGSERGQELLGHELAHVVQQAQGRVSATMQTKGMAVNDDSTLEREADAMGARAARGLPASGVASPALAGSEPTGAVAQAKAEAPAPQALPSAGSQVVQMMPAFRIEGNQDNRKITNDSGKMKLNRSEVQATGISISFKSDEHAEYYARQKQGGIYLTMDAKDQFYEYLMQKSKSNAEIAKDESYSWMANLPTPSGCSDPVMQSMNMASKDVLTFGNGWFAKAKNITNFEKQFSVTSAVSLDQIPDEEAEESSGPAKVYIVLTGDDPCAYEVDSDKLETTITMLNLKEGAYDLVNDRDDVDNTLEIISMD